MTVLHEIELVIFQRIDVCLANKRKMVHKVKEHLIVWKTELERKVMRLCGYWFLTVQETPDCGQPITISANHRQVLNKGVWPCLFAWAKQKWENRLNVKVMVVQVKLPLRCICKKVILRIGEPKKISCTEYRNDLVNKVKIPSTEHQYRNMKSHCQSFKLYLI